MSAFETILLGIRKNNPRLFWDLKSKVCRHKNADRDDDGHLLFCYECFTSEDFISDEKI